MARYKIATKTDKLRYQIAKEVFGEIEDSDGVRDIPSWEIFEKCLEQHKQLKEMKDQLALTEKALELACEDKPRPIKYYGNYMGSVNDYIEFYKTKAEEMMKSE